METADTSSQNKVKPFVGNREKVEPRALVTITSVPINNQGEK